MCVAAGTAGNVACGAIDLAQSYQCAERPWEYACAWPDTSLMLQTGSDLRPEAWVGSVYKRHPSGRQFSTEGSAQQVQHA